MIWNYKDSDNGNDLFNPDQDKPSEPRTCSTWQVCFQGKPWVTWKIPACRAENLALLVFPLSFCSWWTGSEDDGGELSCGTQEAGQVHSEVAWCYSLVLEDDWIGNIWTATSLLNCRDNGEENNYLFSLVGGHVSILHIIRKMVAEEVWFDLSFLHSVERHSVL